MQRVVISSKNLPPNSTFLLAFALIAMALDQYNAPGWLWGIALALGALYLLGWVVEAMHCVEFDVLQPLQKGDKDAKS